LGGRPGRCSRWPAMATGFGTSRVRAAANAGFGLRRSTPAFMRSCFDSLSVRVADGISARRPRVIGLPILISPRSALRYALPSCRRSGSIWVTIRMMESPPPALPAHPGEILKTDFLEQRGMSADELAHEIGMPLGRMNEILIGRRAVSADTATRLADRLGTTPQFWVALQAKYDLALVSHTWRKRPLTQPKLPRRRR
jgi:antitoxin HigA-1